MFKLFWVSNNNEEEFDELSEEIEETENDLWQISLDIIEKDTSIIIIAPIAWVELKHIDITVNKNILIISWNRKKPLEYYEWNILRNSECFWWEFSRNIILPENMDFDNIKAVMENNLLIVNIPRINLDSKSIKINKIES